MNRKVGNQVFYAVRDPVLIEVLDLLRQYFYSHLNETLAMLGEIEQEALRARMTAPLARIPWATWKPKLARLPRRTTTAARSRPTWSPA